MLRGVIAVACCIGAVPLAEAQWAVSAQETKPELPSFIDKRKLPNLTIPPASPAAPDTDEETRRRAEELSKKFSAPEPSAPEQPGDGKARGPGSAIGSANGQPPSGTAAPTSEEAIRRELEAATRRASEAEERARKERARREAYEAESRKAMEQAAAAVAKAQEEAKQAAKRAADAERRALDHERQKGVGSKPSTAPMPDTKAARQAGAGYQAAPRPPAYDERRQQGFFGLGFGGPVK
jgi:hypothetical protein